MILLGMLSAEAQAQIPPPPDGAQGLSDRYTGRAYSPYAGRGFPSRVFWGDTHLHTSFSMDAGAFGNRLGLDEAYRLAQEIGEEAHVVRVIRHHQKIERPRELGLKTS